jgi:hypothetical protein
MASVRLGPFGGLIPKSNRRLLPANYAQTATNADLQAGSLKAFKQVSQVTTLPDANRISLYYYNSAWLSWTTDVDVARGPIANDSYSRIYTTGESVPKVYGIVGGVTVSYTLGMPQPANTPSVSAAAPTSNVQVSRQYVYTFVSAFGEEGPPSSPSAVITIDSGAAVTVGNMSTTMAAGYQSASATKRIYRTETGLSGTQYQFVAEVSLATVSYVDNITAAGEVLETWSPDNSLSFWNPAPTGLKGIIALPNGSLAGFLDKRVRLSVPNQPHAWPPEYEYAVDFTIVGIAPTENGCAIGTSGNPYLLTGFDPGDMTVTKLPQSHACSSKRSMIDIGGGVAYASPDGHVLLSPGGAKLMTEPFYTREQWQALGPTTMLCAFHDRYVFVFATGTTLVFRLGDDGLTLTATDETATGVYRDIELDKLYLIQSSNVKQWEGSSSSKTATYLGKEETFPQPVTFSVGRVSASTYPVTLKIYKDNSLAHTATVADGNPFRLPVMLSNQYWALQAESSGEVYEAVIASSVPELQS